MIRFRVNEALFLTIVIVALFFIVVGPFIEIWAINTLFSFNIEYSWTNWLCVLILNAVLNGGYCATIRR
jgi:ABC-type antimicrobial peptide transport system permease subunit